MGWFSTISVFLFLISLLSFNVLGASASAKIQTITLSEHNQKYELSYERLSFSLGNKTYGLQIADMNEDSIGINLMSSKSVDSSSLYDYRTFDTITLQKGKSIKIDLNKDKNPDLKISLSKVDPLDGKGKAILSLQRLSNSDSFNVIDFLKSLFGGKE